MRKVRKARLCFGAPKATSATLNSAADQSHRLLRSISFCQLITSRSWKSFSWSWHSIHRESPLSHFAASCGPPRLFIFPSLPVACNGAVSVNVNYHLSRCCISRTCFHNELKPQRHNNVTPNSTTDKILGCQCRFPWN